MKKILVITGVTASGKTGLAVNVAKKIGADIISADSRQIYRGMDIGTGKDIGESKFECVKRISKLDIGYHKVEGVRIWLLDLVEPVYKFSVSDYIDAFDYTCKLLEEMGRKIVIAGGSGYYIESVLNPKKNFGAKPNAFLRLVLGKLPTLTIRNLYKFLRKEDFENLNNSEQNNRHRLIRKIEIIFDKNKYKMVKKKYKADIVCLTAGVKFIKKRIDIRIKNRLKDGLLDEVYVLLKKYGRKAFGLNCLAYKEFFDYFEGKKNLKESIEKWRQDEYAYAKRQRTWFGKESYKTVDIEKADFSNLTESIVDGTIFYE